MKRLQVMGNNNAQWIRLEGKPSKPEPEEVGIAFPGGFVYVSRCLQPDGRCQWWAHIGVFHPDHPDQHRIENLTEHGNPGPTGCIVDARVDCFDKHASQTIKLAEILNSPTVDHVAIKVGERA